MVVKNNDEGEDKQSCVPLLNQDNSNAKAVIFPPSNSLEKLGNPTNGKEKFLEVQCNKDAEIEIKDVTERRDFDSIDVRVLTTPLPKGIGLEPKSIWRRCLGLFLALAATIIFSLSSLIIKFLPEVHQFNICVWSFLIGGFLTMPFVAFRSECKKKALCQNVIFPFKKHYKTNLFILLRSMASISAFALFYFAVDYLDLGDAVVIVSSSTIFVYFFSWLLLREDFDLVIIVTGILAIGGVAVIARPPLLTGSTEMDMDLLIGTSLAFACTVLMSISLIFLRFLKHVHYSLLNLILYIWGTFQSIVMAAAYGVLAFPKCQSEWILISSLAALNLLAQSFFASSLKYEQAGHVSLVRTSSILFTFIWQFIFLGVVPDALSIIGAIMIVTGIIVTILRKLITLKQKPKI